MLNPNKVITHSAFGHLQLFLTVLVFFLQESDWIPWISTLTNGSRALPLQGTGRLDPLITCWQREKCSREEREGCNYTIVWRKVDSSAVLSHWAASFSGPDQRQTCMSWSRHASPDTEGALQCPAEDNSPFSFPKSRYRAVIQSHQRPPLVRYPTDRRVRQERACCVLVTDSCYFTQKSSGGSIVH